MTAAVRYDRDEIISRVDLAELCDELLGPRRRAGHTSTSFTLDRYGHLMPGADQALSDRLEALMAPAPTSAAVVPIR